MYVEVTTERGREALLTYQTAAVVLDPSIPDNFCLHRLAARLASRGPSLFPFRLFYAKKKRKAGRRMWSLQHTQRPLSSLGLHGEAALAYKSEYFSFHVAVTK